MKLRHPQQQHLLNNNNTSVPTSNSYIIRATRPYYQYYSHHPKHCVLLITSIWIFSILIFLNNSSFIISSFQQHKKNNLQHNDISVQLSLETTRPFHLIVSCTLIREEEEQPIILKTFPRDPIGAILSWITSIQQRQVIKHVIQPTEFNSHSETILHHHFRKPQQQQHQNNNTIIAYNDWFDLWLQCGVSGEHRLIPKQQFQALNVNGWITYLPGQAIYGSKRGLYEGMIKYHGEEITHSILPQTWFKNRRDENHLLSFALKHPNMKFISKSGHRQGRVNVYTGEEIVKLSLNYNNNNVANDVENDDDVAKWLPPGVWQIMYDTFLVEGTRTAFRTYVWISCIDEQHGTALIDYHAPAYHALNESSIFASGYSGRKTFQDTSMFLNSFLHPTQKQQVKECIQYSVQKFLQAFSSIVCEGRQFFDPQVLVAEVHGFDWIVIPATAAATATGGGGGSGDMAERSNEDDSVLIQKVTCRLLETNRFPDMSLADIVNPIPKDCLKICTFARRLRIKIIKTTMKSNTECDCENDKDEDVVGV
jgi:hypothetical protein